MFPHRRKRVVALVSAAFSAAVLLFGHAAPASAIANGEEVPIGKYAFSVKLTMTGIPTPDGGRRNSACSGSLIAPEWVLTAGHCFRDENGVRVERPVADLTTATVGRTDLDGDGGHQATVIAVRQSPVNDVALARIDTAVTDIKPLRLSLRTPQVGDILRLTGYGSITSVNPTPSTRLRTGLLAVTTVNKTTLGMTGHAPQRDTTPCPFDSGGPFFSERFPERPVLVAIVNSGPSCPHTLDETTARIDVIVPWIRSVIG